MRYDAKTFQTLPYFKNLLVSVLKFMERDSFAARTKEETVSYTHLTLPTNREV